MAREITGVDSAKQKIRTAAKHLKAIKRSIARYSASRPYKIRIVKIKGEKTIHVTILRRPPLEISILAGEMIYQMRSALDHLAFALIKCNATGIPLPAKWEERTEFPICIKIPTSGNPPVPHPLPAPQGTFSRTLPGISLAAFAFIEGLQPYYGKGATNHALRFLRELSNIDKHRHLNIVVGRIQRLHDIRFASGVRVSGYETLDSSVKIQEETGRSKSDRAVYVRNRFRTPVHFGESVLGDAASVPLAIVLQTMLEKIQTTILPAFCKFIK